MEKKEQEKSEIAKPTENKDELKPKDGDQLHKGYNEKNPVQPEGAFTPDSKTGK